MEAKCTSGTSVDFQRTTRRYISEDSILLRPIQSMELRKRHHIKQEEGEKVAAFVKCSYEDLTFPNLSALLVMPTSLAQAPLRVLHRYSSFELNI
jgi:hypothetical protein